MLPYTAYLRVYEPLEAFPEPERSWWTAHAERREQVGHADPGLPAASWPRGMRRPPAHDTQSAYVRRFSDRTYICPWKRRLRSWEAFSAAQRTPAAAAAPADPHIRESNWHVPFPWFVPFVREERTLELGGKPATAPPRALVYLTTMARAGQRLARATIAGERAMTDVSPFGDAQSLQEELSAFHPQSLVELDYGGLVHLMDDDTLTADDSVGECAVALVALERGELELAVAMQLRLRTRWRAIRALQSAN
ncbi:hypothetical protein ABGB12_21665 [Actinocorallia sp. B10E7]|uniref:hypothetical protein n=1 Tax=Actinocorallia sp. B10E7 TaxID=3153558 RepID=UPI00325E2659